MAYKSVTALLLFLSLAACGDPLENQLYQNNGPTNLTVRQTAAEAGFMSLGATSIAVYQETAEDCVFDFVGTIKVKSGSQTAALPPGHRFALRLNFNDQDFLGSTTNGSQIVRLFTPRAGHQYDFQMAIQHRGLDYSLFDVTNGQRRLVNMPALLAVCH